MKFANHFIFLKAAPKERAQNIIKITFLHTCVKFGCRTRQNLACPAAMQDFPAAAAAEYNFSILNFWPARGGGANCFAGFVLNVDGGRDEAV